MVLLQITALFSSINRTHSDLSTEIYMAKYIYIFQIYWETLSQIYKYMQYVFI